MARCIIHIGMHKTGSSSIQSSLAGFSDDQFLYADLDNNPNHSLAMFTLFSDNPDQHFMHYGKDNIAIQNYKNKLMVEMEKSIKATQGRSLIISGEDMVSLSPSGVSRMKDFFSPWFNEVIIIAYVRPPAGFIASVFQENLKRIQVDLNDLDKDYYSYMPKLAKYDDIFGRNNVYFFKFEPKSFPNNCAVQDFCARLGLTLPANKIIRVNESLSRKAIALIYLYRKFGQQYGQENMKTIEGERLGRFLSAHLGQEKFSFASDISMPILEKHRDDILWMESRLGESLAENLDAYNTGGVRDESDLLQQAQDFVNELLSLLGNAVPTGIAGHTNEEVALLVHLLRQKITNESISNKNAHATTTRLKSGRVMLAEPHLIAGWAIGESPDNPVKLALIVNGKEITQTIADKQRPALKERGIHPTGYCGFNFNFSENSPLKVGDQVEVILIDNNFSIENSPCNVSSTVKTQ